MVRIQMDEDRRNYLVEKRAALAANRYIDQRKIALISGDNKSTEFYRDRILEHLSVMGNISQSLVERESIRFIISSFVLGLITIDKVHYNGREAAAWKQ